MKGALILLLAAAALPAAAAAPAAKPASSRADWSRTVAVTPEGGFRMGNPAAKVKLVEYGSLTCDHCATFAKDGMASLVGDYVKSGQVSYEYRNFILNGLDVAATLVARCGGAKRFFPVADKLYATQSDWKGRTRALTDDQRESINKLPEGQRLNRLAELVGIPAIAAQGGISPAKSKRCLLDRVAFDGLGKMSEAATAKGVGGTPTFFINDTNVGSHTWSTLEPLLKEAAG